MLRVLLLSSVLAAGCATAPTLDAPYPFSSGLLNPTSALATSPPPRRRPRRGVKRARRGRRARPCRGLIGRRAPSPSEATRALLRCAGGKALHAERLDALELAREPREGSLVLFHNARDVNGNGLVDDPKSGVGAIIGVRGALVYFVYRSGTRYRKGVLHLDSPNRRRIAGRIVNSYVRQKDRRDPPSCRYLAGQLLAGFARPL